MILEEYVDDSFNHQDWYRWKDRYKGQLKDPEDAYVAIQTMLASLNDEYTRFLPPRDMREQTLSIDSRLYGIGIQIGVRDNKLQVVSVLEDTPAEAAGLKAKDQIIRIDGQETAGMTVEQAADRIRGKEGTAVKLTIRRGEKTVVEEIVRAEIRLKSVFTEELEDDRIGYVRLNSFISETATAEMHEILQKMKDKKAIILDLRGNYGGLLDNAVAIADMFLEKGDIVSIVNRKQERRTYRAYPGQNANQPMVILIDGGSASASEILSGALKDHRRATLIGTQSYGKGLVQKINPLPDGSGLNITISKYFTPKGTDIDHKGIAPDIVVEYTEKDFLDQTDPQLQRAIQYLEKKHRLAAQ